MSDKNLLYTTNKKKLTVNQLTGFYSILLLKSQYFFTVWLLLFPLYCFVLSFALCIVLVDILVLLLPTIVKVIK